MRRSPTQVWFIPIVSTTSWIGLTALLLVVITRGVPQPAFPDVSSAIAPVPVKKKVCPDAAEQREEAANATMAKRFIMGFP